MRRSSLADPGATAQERTRMRTMIHAGIAASLLTATLALPTIASNSTSISVAPSAVGGGAPEVGEIVEHKFGTPPMNSGGLSSLADFRGRPLLIEFWGTR